MPFNTRMKTIQIQARAKNHKLLNTKMFTVGRNNDGIFAVRFNRIRNREYPLETCTKAF